jgi:hypothetical protein
MNRAGYGASRDWGVSVTSTERHQMLGHPSQPKEVSMFVTVLHHITDPLGFEAAEAKAIEAGLPANVALPIHAATPDHRTGVCIWEGESVDAVRDLVESVVGPFSNNEYFQMNVDGLEPALA